MQEFKPRREKAVLLERDWSKIQSSEGFLLGPVQLGIANQFSEQLIYSLHGHASQCENCCDVLLNLFVCVAFFCSRIIAAMQHPPIHSGALWHKDVLSEKWCLLWVFSALAYRTMRTYWEWEMVLNCNSRWCNISFFAVEGVNLIDASILNSRLTYCAVQPVDSFQIIVLLILTQPFIIICIQPTTLLMFCNPISDAFYVDLLYTPYEHRASEENSRRMSFLFYMVGYLWYRNDRE